MPYRNSHQHKDMQLFTKECTYSL